MKKHSPTSPLIIFKEKYKNKIDKLKCLIYKS